MAVWGWILILGGAWCVVSAAVAVIVGRAVWIRDEKERGPRVVPDYIPESTRRLARGGVCVDLADRRRTEGITDTDTD